MANDVRAIDETNEGIRKTSSLVFEVLNSATGEGLGEDREAWKAWWSNQLGYAYTPPDSRPRPTLVQNVPLGYQPSGMRGRVHLHPRVCLPMNASPVPVGW